MTTTPSADRSRTALDLVVEAIARLQTTDPSDTTASLLAAWHGFGTAEAAGQFLAQDNVDDAVLARNARPVMAAVAVLLREAPSLPYTDEVVETVDGLVPDGFQIPADDRTIVYYNPGQPLDESAAGIVRRSIQTLALMLNTLLPQAAEHAEHPADRVACEHGTRLAYELGCCWEGQLSSFLNSSRDLSAPGRPRRQSGKNTRHKRTKKRA
ncbi:hypothetical protein HFP15_30975 [Amycolatopsis sp. K13G38]|uniref:Uncharacterized protein n=1 Tax=Amycolatopsis acididurans TaxID=2724524 RepID=A0ABX1JBY2_9PSEU|nr:hypothetical protein [Amycolatopsis acididurans]NKQ57300.1 hypothetical protein [Amycolatopsis acididurans]